MKLRTKYQILVVQWLLMFLIQKNSEAVNKTSNNSKYIATQELDKLTAENFAARLKQAWINDLL